MRFGVLSAAVIAAGVAAAGAAEAVVPLSGQINFAAYATLDGATVNDADSVAWTGAPPPSASAAAVAIASGSSGLLAAYQLGSAHWGANAGYYNMHQGLDAQWSGITDFAYGVAVAPAPDWSYTFQAEGDGVFTLDWDLTATGFDLSLIWFLVSWSDEPFGQPHAPADFGFRFVGSLSKAIQAGQTYTVAITHGAALSGTTTPLGQHSGAGVFNYAITETAAVPEPAAWALMIGGFGLAGLGLRRRRTAVAGATIR